MVDVPVVDNDDTIIKLRVERSIVRDFPFDVFYLVPFAQRHIIAKMFPWSLCLPPHESFMVMVRRLVIYMTETLPHKGRRKHERQVHVNHVQEHIDLTQCFVVIPTMPLATTDEAREKKVKLPAYITAPRHARVGTKVNNASNVTSNQGRFSHILTDDTVLFTPEGPITPVCHACPRHLLHVMNKCQLGCQHCFDDFILKGGTVDEQLQDNNPDPDSSP